MSIKLTDKALDNFEATRDIWQEVLDGIKEIKAGGGHYREVKPTSSVVHEQLKTEMPQSEPTS